MYNLMLVAAITVTNESLLADAMGEVVQTNPVLLGIGSLILVFFTMMMFKDFFTKIFAILIGVVFLQLLVTGGFDKVTGIIILCLSFAMFIARFGMWFAFGWNGQVGLLDGIGTEYFNLKETLTGRPAGFDFMKLFILMGDAFKAAWEKTFVVGDEAIRTYFKWR